MDNLESNTADIGSVQTTEANTQGSVQQPVSNVQENVQQPVTNQEAVQQPQPVEPVNEPTETTQQEEQLKAVEFTPSGNEVFDTLGSALAEKGLDPNTYYQEAVAAFNQYGEPELSEESFQELVSVYGEKVATLMEKQFTAEFKNQQNQQKQIADSIYNEFGGEESFRYVADAVMKEGLLSKEDAEELGQLLGKPGVTQKMAIKQLKELYMETSQYQQNPQLVNEGQPSQPVGLQPISRREYTKEKMKAMSEKNYALVEQLNRRADFTMKSSPQVWK